MEIREKDGKGKFSELTKNTVNLELLKTRKLPPLPLPWIA